MMVNPMMMRAVVRSEIGRLAGDGLWACIVTTKWLIRCRPFSVSTFWSMRPAWYDARMSTRFDTLDLSHHAYVIIGGQTERDDLILTLSKKHAIKIAGNPDFFDRRYEIFSIDDARALKSLAETRAAFAGAYKVFVLTMNGITIEAQNALLKLFEEPGEHARFFLILPSAHLLIPTIKSRIQFLVASGTGSATSVTSESNADIIKAAKAFLAAPVKTRLDIVKDLMDQIAKEKKTKQDAVDLLNALEEQVHASAKGAAGLSKSSTALEAILLAGTYATDRAPSMKMLLEYVALNV